MVEFNHILKTYDRAIVSVDDVSFKIEKGEFVFLIGPSGSGKTTIIKMLIRDEVPTEGKIFFDDVDITKINRKKVYKLRREIGVIFQDFKLVPDKTAYENVAFAMEAAGKTNKDIQDTVPYVLDIVGLANRSDSFPRQLSGGEQQRVAIARAIANNPKILIADEPTGNLDPASAWDIVQILTKINNWGTTVIMSTHGTDIVNSLNKRVIQMDKGKVIRDDNKGQYEMISVFEDNLLNTEVSDKKGKKKNKKTYKMKLEEDEEVKEEIVNITSKRNGFGQIFNRFRKKHENKEQSIADILEKPSKDIYEESDIKLDELQNDIDEIVKKPKVDGIQVDNIKNEIEDSEVPAKEISESKDVAHRNNKEELHLEVKSVKKSKIRTQKGVESVKDLSWSEEAVTKFIENSKKVIVDDLDLPKAVIKDLKAAGYKDVNSIIEAGPEKLSQSLLIDPEEIVMVSKAIKELLNKD